MLDHIYKQFQLVDTHVPQTVDGDLRIGHLLKKKQDDWTNIRVALIGFPVDAGVRLNHGRIGAGEAANAIRSFLYRMTPDTRNYEMQKCLWEQTLDLGNLASFGDLAKLQDQLADIIALCFEKDVFPIVIGGGHETAFGVFSAYAKRNSEVEIANIDAHTDVRELTNGKAHSGSPFRQALEHESGLCSKYRVAGLLPWAVSQIDLAYMKEKNAEMTWYDELEQSHFDDFYSSTDHQVMATFDMDAVEMDSAPGVSAPAIQGTSKELWLYAAKKAGLSPAVKSFDLAEVNPRHDVDGRTSRLAALTIWNFIQGLSERFNSV